MATYTDNGTNTPNGSHKVFTYTFPALQTEDIKVALNGIVQATTKYTASLSPAQIEFNNTSIDSSVQESTGAPKTGVQVRVFRETTVGKNSGDEDPKAVFAAGSSIRAADLNANQEQALFAIHELQTQPVKTSDIEPDAVTNAKIADNAIDSEHYVDGSIDRVHLAADIVDGTKIADNSIDSEHYVDASIDHVHLANDCIDGSNIQDDVINTEHYADTSIRREHIAAGEIIETKIANSAVTSNKIADNAVTTTEILNGAVTRTKLEADIIDGTKLADNAVDSEHYTDGSIDRVHLEADIIDSTKLADNAVNSEHYVDGSIDHVHLANDIIDGDNIQDDVVNSEHIVAGALDNEHYAAGSITSDKLNGATVVTNSEQAASTPNDTSFFTTAAAEARYFNASTGETIKDGQSFPDNDTTIATTAAINDRIIDLVDDVGGFVPIANETSFPNANPDVNNGTGTIVSVSTLASNHTSNGSGVITISNGTVGNSTVTINGAANNTTYSAGYGLLVETTTTLNTYTFHRLVPKATEVTTVAGKATEIGRLGTADAVADMAILGTADVVSDLNTLGTADVVADMNMLATSDVISDMNTLAVSGVISDMDTVATNVTNVNNVGGSIANVNTTAGSIANVNTVAGSISNVNTTAGSIANVNTTAGSIANVNTVATNINNVNDFFDKYRVGANNPTSSLDTGDLFFNTTSNSLKVYTGSAWVDGVTTTGNFALKTGNTFTGSNVYNDNAKALFGTSSDLEIFHDGSHSIIQETGTGDLELCSNTRIMLQKTRTEALAKFIPDGAVELNYDNSQKFRTESGGIVVTGNVRVPFDNHKIILGASQDLKIYHDGSNSYIEDNGTGSLVLNTNALYINNAANDENLITAAENGNVELFHNNIKKFETTANGVTISGTQSVINGNLDVGAGLDVTGNITATGTISSGNINITSVAPIITLTDTNANDDFEIKVNGGLFEINDITNSANRFIINSDGTVDILGNLDVGAGLDVTGNITVSGTVDGVDIAALNTTVGNISTEVVNDSSPQLGGDLQSNGNNITLGDSSGSSDDRITLGASADLQIYHNGTDSAIYDFGTGRLKLYSNGAGIDLRKDNGEAMILANTDGSVELYNNNSKKFMTTSGGAEVYGELQMDDANSHIKIPDNARIDIGAGNDLQIYHDGTHSRIVDNGAYATSFQSNLLRIHDNSGNFEYLAEFNANGAVELYFDNSQKLQTYSGGVKIQSDGNIGRLVLADTNGNFAWQLTGYDEGSAGTGGRGVFQDATGAVVLDMRASGGNIHSYNTIKLNAGGTADNLKVTFGASDDLQIYHDGSNSFIKDAGTGNLKVVASVFQLRNAADTETMIEAHDNGQVELYHNNEKVFYTDAGGVIVNDSDTTSYVKLLNTNGTAGYLYGSGATDTGLLDGNGSWLLRGIKDGKLELYYDGSVKFETTAEGVKVDGGLIEIAHSSCHLDFMETSTTNHRLRNGSGNFHIQRISDDKNTTTTQFLVDGGTGAVKLFYNGSQKLETADHGITVSGRARFNQPFCSFYGVNNASGASGWKIFQWRVQQEKRHINDSSSVSNFTPQQAGWYLVVLNHYHGNGTHSNYYLRILKNNSVSWGYRKFDNAFSGNLSAVMYFNGTSDYFNLATYHSNNSHPDEDDELTNFSCIYLSQ